MASAPQPNVKRVKTRRAEPPECYKMASRPRGKCLIINNEDYEEDKESLRPRTLDDAISLQHVFTELGFEVTLKKDQTLIQMKALLRDFGENPSHNNYSAGVIIILAHGNKDNEEETLRNKDPEKKGSIYVQGVNNLPLYILEIAEFVNNKNCSGLKGKPKMIFVQACPGSKLKKVTSLQSDSTRQPTRLPTNSDIILSLALQRENPEFPGKGGFYARILANALAEHACDFELLEILQLVEREVQEENKNGVVMTTEFRAIGWSHPLYFNPGL